MHKSKADFHTVTWEQSAGRHLSYDVDKCDAISEYVTMKPALRLTHTLVTDTEMFS